MTSVEIRLYTLCIPFLDRTCSQENGEAKCWKDDARKHFQLLRCVHTCWKAASSRLHQVVCFFFRECRISLKHHLRAKDDFSDDQVLACKALHYLLFCGSISDGRIVELRLTKHEARAILP